MRDNILLILVDLVDMIITVIHTRLDQIMSLDIFSTGMKGSKGINLNRQRLALTVTNKVA